MNNNEDKTGRDLNRDPISGAPGSHPVGVGVGGIAGGAAAGALVGTFFGPLGTLIGAGVGVIAGAAAGKNVAERIDPTGEIEYWRDAHQQRPYVAEHADKNYEFDRDYAAAYGYGLQAREQHGTRNWDESESDLRQGWDKARGESRMAWDEAKSAVRDSWDRADHTYKTYEQSDRYHAQQFENAPFRGADDRYEDFQPAYRYGTQARSRYGDRNWDDSLEQDLRADWDKRPDGARLTWERAKAAIKDAFSSDHSRSARRGNDSGRF